MTDYQALLEQAKQLPGEQRIVLAREIVQSVDEDAVTDNWSEAWLAEARRRLDAYDRGEMASVDIRDVLQEAEVLLERMPRTGSKNQTGQH